MGYSDCDCVDAGSEFCPCFLAETGDCLICSQLQGLPFCDCVHWKGVCIFQEYVWRGERIASPREIDDAGIVRKAKVSSNTYLLRLGVGAEMARKLNMPGSYIFIREKGKPSIFDAPMSVMDADENEGTVDILLQRRGSKTKFAEGGGKDVCVRGPYYNGIMGLKYLKMLKGGGCIIAARGIAQSPAVMVAKKLRSLGSEVTVLLDPGRSRTDFSKSYFEQLGCDVRKTVLLDGARMSGDASALLTQAIGERNAALIFSGGSDLLHKSILKLKDEIDRNIMFCCTNNARICCGEGICGSCGIRDIEGRRIKACKAQIDPASIFGGGSDD